MKLRGISRELFAATPVRFVLAGTVGFVVDAAVLYGLMTVASLSPMVGRVGSFLCASFVTWRVNRRFTFGAASAGNWLFEWVRYFWASVAGALVNYLVFAVLIVISPVVARMPTLAVAAGSIAGMLINFVLYSRFVFRKPLSQPQP